MALDRELPAWRAAAVDEHVSACAACRARVHQIRTALAEATGLDESADEPLAPSFRGSRVRLERALQEAADEWNQPWSARLRSVLNFSSLNVAARPAGLGVAVLVVLAAVWMSNSARLVLEPMTEPAAPLPMAWLTPGAVSNLTARELCAGARPSRLVTADSQQQVLRSYRMQNVSARTYELDALITPELGGTTVPANLWPQRYDSPVWNARVKDELETLLPKLVCSQVVELGLAQQEIARDWVAAYKRYFQTDLPLQAHLGAPTVDEELELVPIRYVGENPGQAFATLRFAGPW